MRGLDPSGDLGAKTGMRGAMSPLEFAGLDRLRSIQSQFLFTVSGFTIHPVCPGSAEPIQGISRLAGSGAPVNVFHTERPAPARDRPGIRQ